ncbi:MAG: sialate O-acetylesterase [Kiritimatiellales bacterium]
MMKRMVMGVLCLSAGFVQSAEIYKADNATALNQSGSWEGGAVPKADDTAVYTGLGAHSTAMGSDFSWYGIAATNNSGVWTITGSETLALGAGGMTTGGGTAGGLVINAALHQDADAIYNAPGGRDITLYGTLSGSGGITKSGSGNLIINADGSGYTGDIQNTAGVISVGADYALGSGRLILAGGMLNAGGTSRTLTNPVSVSANSRLEAVNSSRNLILAGVISGDSSSSLSMVNAGSVTLSGNNTFSGGVSLGTSQSTTLIVGNNSALGSGTLSVSGSGGFLGASGSVSAGNAVNLDADLEIVDAGGNLFLTGTLSGSGTLTKSGTKAFLLSGNNAGFSGAIIHNAGVLSVGNNNGLGSGVLTLNGGLLNAYSTDRILPNKIIISADSRLEAVNTSRDMELSGSVSGSGAVTKIGTGTVTLSGTCTYTNATTVSAGTLRIDGTLISPVTVASGAVLSGAGQIESATMQSGSTLEPGSGSDPLIFGGTLNLEAGATVMLGIPGSSGFDILAGDGSGTLNAAGDFVFDFTGNSTVQAGDSFTVLQDWNTIHDNGLTAAVMGLDDGLTLDLSGLTVNGSITVVSNAAAETAKTTGLLYAGIYTGTDMAPGFYTFTDPGQPTETATRVGSLTSLSDTYRHVGFDGEKYLTVKRDGGRLYENNGMTSLFTLLSGNYSYSSWHGMDRCNDVYYGIYDGESSAMEGPGLYVFSDPADPEGTCVRICTNQVFSSNVWTDVAFDGERYLFVRTDADGGTAGIYQYDPDIDQFSLISGSETYADWEGLAVFNSDVAPLRNRKVYLLLFGGQSNALGWGYHQYLLDHDDPLQDPQEDIDFLYAVPYANVGTIPERTLIPLQSGNSNSQVKQPGEYPELTNAPISRFGPELSFARTVRDRIRIPHAKTAVMKYAYGGSALYSTSQWFPDGTADRSADGTLYQRFQQTVWRTIAALKNKYPYSNVEILGMGWVQGETDAMDGAADDYKENLTRFIQDVRVTFGTNITFVLSKLSPNQYLNDTNHAYYADWTVVRAAQQAVADADPYVEATETAGDNYLTSAGLSEGQLHYKTASLLQIGDDLGNALMDTCGLDSDEDGLPDQWEVTYFGDLNVSDGNSDTDKDGVSDLNEFLLGTNPNDSQDRLTLSISSALSGSWLARKDIHYQMMKSTNLVSWMSVGNPVLLRVADATVDFDLSDYIQAKESKGFFRLSVE